MRNILLSLSALLVASCAALGYGHDDQLVYVVEATGGGS
jgi:hypothetical protein